nr:putative ribonuclease H-like domain-containing protein [Tanacetum cinerariifolium]
MLDKDMMNRQRGRMILESVENGPLIWPTIEDNGVTSPRKYAELTPADAIQADCDVKGTNIILQGLPPEEKECKLYDEFDKFAYKKEKTLYSGLAIPVFKQGDDLIDAINHMMSFLSVVVTSRYPTTNNQLRNSSNPRQQTIINDERLTLQPVQGRQVSFATDPGIAEGQATQIVITHNAAYQANDLDAYDCDCDELNTAKVALMANLSHDGLDVLADNSMNSLDPNPSCTPIRVEVPKVGMVNMSLKKLKHHLVGFDVVVKERTMATTITEGSNNSVSNQSAPNFDQYFELNELKAQSQEKDMVIRKLKERIKSLSGNVNKDKVKKDMDEIETINFELDHMVSKLMARNEHLKQTYKQLYDSIKPTHEKGLIITALRDELRKLKGKALVDNEVVEQGTSQNPLNNSLYFACKYTKRIHELLIIIRQTCPSINNSSDKLVAVTPKNKNKRVRFTEPVTSLGNTNTKTSSSSNLVSNKPMLSSTGVKLSTSASRSQPSGNTKKDRIQQPPSSTQKNKVEAYPRTVKSSLKNKNCVVEPTETSIVQYSKLNANFELICVKCNGCMLSDNHDLCVLNVINDVIARPKSKSVKITSKRKVWKPTGKVFTKSGYTWRPTKNDTPKPIVTLVYSRKLRKSKTNVPVSKPKIIKSISANNKKPNKSCGSIVSDVPSSSLDECRNVHMEKIMGYEDYYIGNVTISKVYYVEGLGHNLFFIGKKKPYKPKSENTNQEKLYLLHMDLCGPMRVASVNGKKYILVIVDDYSRFTWVKCLRSKDETPEFIIKFLKMIQLRLKAPVLQIRTDNGTEFVNQNLREYYEKVGISHEKSVARFPQQNGVVERRNRTLIEAAYTISSRSCCINRFTFLNNVDQDAPSPSNSQTSPETQSLVIPNDVKEENHDLDVVYKNNDPFFGISIPKNISKASSSSDVIPTVVHTAAPNSKHVNKLTKDHPLDNITSELERPVSTRLQLYEQALFCYYDAFLSSVKPKTYKDALTQAYPTLFIRREGKDILLISQSPRGVFLNQSKYALESLKKYGMESSNPVDTPMAEKFKLEEDPHGKAIDPTHYRGMAKPTEKHLHAVKRIFKYLRGTINRGLWYSKDSSIALTAYADVDHAGCQDTRRSTSGNALKLTPFYKAFQITANAPKIYMQEFWATVSIHYTLLRFKMNDKSHTLNLETFRDMLQICPKLPGQKFKDPPFKEEILSFIRDLDHTGEIKGMYHKRNVDYVYLLWEDLVYQVENKNPKKNNDIYSKAYKEYYAVASGAEPLKAKTKYKKKENELVTPSKSKSAPVAKGTRLKNPAKVTQSGKKRRPVSMPKAKGLVVLSELALTEAKQIKLATKRSKKDFYMSHASGSSEGVDTQSKVPDEQQQKVFGTNEGAGVRLEMMRKKKKKKADDDEEVSLDQRVSTPPKYELTEEEENKEGEDEDMEGKQEQDKEDDLYRDVNINLERSDAEMTNAQAHQDTEDTHILFDKMEKNQSINRSDIQKNLYNALVESYNYDKDIITSYGDVVILKRGKEAESLREPTHKESKSTRSSKGASRSQPISPGKSCQEEKHGQTVNDLEEQTHQEFNTGNDDVTPVREVLDDDESWWNPSSSLTPDHEWHKTKTVENRLPQSWITQMAQGTGTQSSFNEFLATPIDFSAFIMNRLKIHNLTQKLLTGLTYDLIKGTCKSVVEFEYHLEEFFKATNDRLDWHNLKGKPYPHNLSKPLPLI